MPQNPAYALLSENGFKLPGYTLIRKEQKPYVLINLSEESQRIQFRNQPFVLVEHHLSIYKEFTLGSNAAISAFHYTAKTEKHALHAYFDHNGHYLQCHLKLIEDDSIIALTPDEKRGFQYSSQSKINHPLTLILESLKNHYHRSREQLDGALAQLEMLSRKKMDQRYLSAITDVLELVDKVNSYRFEPDLNTKRLLLNQAHVVSEQINNPPTKDKPAASSQGHFDKEERKQDQISQRIPELNHETERVDLLNQLTILQKEKLTLKQLKKEDKIIDRLLEIIPPQDCNLVLKIVNRKNALVDKRKNIIKEACFNNDIKTVQDMLDLRDEYFIQELVLNSLINNQEKMIYFLYDNYKFQKIHLFHRGYSTKLLVNEKPINIPLEDIPIPLLYGAYEKKNVSLFCNLLDKYQENPDSEIIRAAVDGFIGNMSLLEQFIADNALDYAKKLLDSGANPNKQEYFVKQWDEDSKKLVPVSKLTFNSTPLHAAFEVSTEAVKLLLDYKADSTIRDYSGYTAYGRAASNYPLNIKTIELFIATGKHAVDELQTPQAITPLYCACEDNQSKAAIYFIEKGANSLHTVANAVQGIKLTSPLVLMAVINKNVRVTQKMVEQLKQSDNPLIRKEIQKILLMGVSDQIRAILEPFYKKLCLEAADKEFHQRKYSVAASLYKEIFRRCSPSKSEESQVQQSLDKCLSAADDLEKEEVAVAQEKK